MRRLSRLQWPIEWKHACIAWEFNQKQITHDNAPRHVLLRCSSKTDPPFLFSPDFCARFPRGAYIVVTGLKTSH